MFWSVCTFVCLMLRKHEADFSTLPVWEISEQTRAADKESGTRSSDLIVADLYFDGLYLECVTLRFYQEANDSNTWGNTFKTCLNTAYLDGTLIIKIETHFSYYKIYFLKKEVISFWLVFSYLWPSSHKLWGFKYIVHGEKHCSANINTWYSKWSFL